ncbi:MAG TPA: FUSC family protein [Chloroflexota bacterium]|nr:FUSC family protein [Chloroflexota bacterium]
MSAMTVARAARQVVRLPPPHDPGLAGTRRGARAALVAPLAFAFATLVIGNPQFATFTAFGCFALLVLADFGGTRRPRAVAYAVTTLVGAVLVAVGTLASSSPWLAAAVMLLIGFGVQFAGIFGGYVAAAQTALLLSFVLAVSIPATPSVIGVRLAGWCLAGLLALLAGVFLWPRFERVTLRQQAAVACRALAGMIVAQREGPMGDALARRVSAARDAVAVVRRSFAATPKRPAGPARRDRAFVELLTELERILALAVGPLQTQLSAHHPCIEAGHALAATVAQALEASATTLDGGPLPDLVELQEARLAHREALDRWAAERLRTGDPPEKVLAGLAADDALRVVSYLALAVGADAVITRGGQVSERLHLPAETPRQVGLAAMLRRGALALVASLTPSSSALHNSLRVGIGLGLAVLLSRLLQLDHAFWVVLATLSVLRSSALATGRTTVQALTGTTLGFVAGALVMLIVGANSPALWVTLPVAIFLAAYAASALGFAAGQAGFTATVIILFNLIAPAGWRLGLVRVEDVAIGAGISVVAGLFLWPRGARGELGRTVALLYRAVANLLAATFDHAFGETSDTTQARVLAVRAFDRAGEAFDQFLRERGAKPLDPQSAASLVAAGGHAIVAADLLNGMVHKGYQASRRLDPDMSLHEQARALDAMFRGLANRLVDERAEDPPAGHGLEAALRAASLACLRQWQIDPSLERAAIGYITIAEWIQILTRLAATLEEPVAQTTAIVRRPWWR